MCQQLWFICLRKESIQLELLKSYPVTSNWSLMTQVDLLINYSVTPELRHEWIETCIPEKVIWSPWLILFLVSCIWHNGHVKYKLKPVASTVAPQSSSPPGDLPFEVLYGEVPGVQPFCILTKRVPLSYTFNWKRYSIHMLSQLKLMKLMKERKSFWCSA